MVTVTLTDGSDRRRARTASSRSARCPTPTTSGSRRPASSLKDGGFVNVDRVSRTSARGVYAAGDCTGVLMLASVAAMQGRIAMWHFLGDAVHPLDLKKVSSNVFTAPEIATVGWSQQAIDAGEIQAEAVTLPLSGNARAKMQGVHDGFVKLFCRPGTGIVVGGVVVAPRASELIHPVSVAVAESLTADQLAQAFTVYPSMSGSVAEAARRLHHFRAPDPSGPFLGRGRDLASEDVCLGTGPAGPLLRGTRRRPDRLRRLRHGPADAGLDLLAQPPPARLGEPGVAALPRATSAGSSRSSGTTSAATASPTGTSPTTASRRGSATSRRSRTTPASTGSR